MKAPADSEDIKKGIEVSGFNDVNGWGIEHEIQRTVFSKSIEIDIVDVAFEADPKKCEWIKEDPSPWPWVLYLQGTLTLKVKAKQKDKWGPQLQGQSVIVITNQIFPLGTETYEELRSLIPPKNFKWAIQKLIWWMDDPQQKYAKKGESYPKWVGLEKIDWYSKQNYKSVFSQCEDAINYMNEKVAGGQCDFRVIKQRA